MKILRVLQLCCVMGVLLLAIACSPTSITSHSTNSSATPSVIPSTSPASPRATTSLSSTPPETWVQTLKNALAQELGTSPEQIQLKEATPMEWSDACLELPKSDEFCAQTITPGYQATFRTPQGEYLIHSDRTGRSVRIAESAL